MDEGQRKSAKDRQVERIVSENAHAALRLRLRRMTSATICGRILTAKHKHLSSDAVSEKAEGVASALRSALGFWETNPTALNAKILAQYYFALQLSIAAQVSNSDPSSNLAGVQRHTEQGHGLATLSAPDTPFPDRYYTAALRSGHFGSYCHSIGVDLGPVAFDSRPRSWSKLSVDDRAKLVSLSDLLRRVPELRPSIYECLGVPPLSFHVAHSFKNMAEKSEQARELQQKTGRYVLTSWGPDPSDPTPTKTYLVFATGFGGGEGLSPEYLSELGLPIINIGWVPDVLNKRDELTGEYVHPSNEFWWESLPLYDSSTGTSLIVPVWGTSDPFLVHFTILYALSIIVRYLPSLWYEIEHGPLDHIRALLEQYVEIVDVVLPKLAVERITGRRLQLIYPGSGSAPI